jgi:predicted porin
MRAGAVFAVTQIQQIICSQEDSMNKKLLTVAVGAALAATAMSASAEVKVFGAAQFEVAAINETSVTTDEITGVDTSDTSDYSGNLRDRQRGRWGIKASEDIGHGMKGLAHIEYDTQGDGDNNGTGCGGLGCGGGERQIWAGIKGKFGMITGGSHHGIYKTYGGVKWDPFVATNLEARGNNGMSGSAFGHNNFLDRTLRYVSPKLGPVTIAFIRGFDYADTKDNLDGVAPEDETEGTNTDGSHWQLGAKGKFGPVEGIAVYGVQKKQKNTSGTGTETDAEDSPRVKIGARFSFAKMHKIALQIESIKDRQGADQTETHIFLNWVGKFGKIMPVVGYGIYTNVQEDIQSTSDFTEAGAMLQAGVAWRPSKTFRVFGGILSAANVTEEEDRASGTLLETVTETKVVYSVGIRKDF